MLVDEGADCNLTDQQGNTPLLLAAINGSAKVANLLLNASPGSAAATDHEGRSALHLAAQGDFRGICRALLDSGIGVDVKDDNGLTTDM